MSQALSVSQSLFGFVRSQVVHSACVHGSEIQKLTYIVVAHLHKFFFLLMTPYSFSHVTDNVTMLYELHVTSIDQNCVLPLLSSNVS